jgi:hypothetical protein
MKTPDNCGVAIASFELKPLRLEDALQMAAAYVRRKEDPKFEATSARLRC